MVCSCENRCSCEEHCISCKKCPGAVCDGKNICNPVLFPGCNADLADSKDKIKFCQCFQSDSKICRKHSTATLSTARNSNVINKAKPTIYESSNDSIVPLLTTSRNSTLNDSDSLKTENEQIKPSAHKASTMPRFGSLIQTLRKMRSAFKKTKYRKNNKESLLATEQGHESSEESPVETILSKETDCSPGKRNESLNNKSYSTGNLLSPFPKAEHASFSSSLNIEEISHEKSSTLILYSETSAFSEKQHGKSTGITVDDVQVSRNQTISCNKGSANSLQSCSTPLFSDLNWSNIQFTENETMSASSNKKEDCKLAEVKKRRMVNLKNAEKFPNRQFDISYKPTIFIRNFIKSRSTSDHDKSITMPLVSVFRDELSATRLHSSAVSLSSSSDKGKDAESLNCKIHRQVANSEVVNVRLNESPIALISPQSSTFCDKVGTPHSFSRKPLHASQSHQSLVSRSFLELSLNETISLNNSDIQDQNIVDATTLNFVPSDFSDNFETLDMRSSPDSMDSESVSSSEFLPCSYCRYVTWTPLISDSVIPYETLE